MRQGDTDNNGRLSCSEIAVLMEKAQKTYPQLLEHSMYFDCEQTSKDMSAEWLPSWLQARGHVLGCSSLSVHLCMSAVMCCTGCCQH